MAGTSLLSGFLDLIERFAALTATQVDDVAVSLLRTVADNPTVAHWLDQLAQDMADWIDGMIATHDDDGVPEDTLPIIDMPGDVRAQLLSAGVNLDTFMRYLPAILAIWKMLKDARGKFTLGE